MAVTRGRNSIRFVTGDVDILRGEARTDMVIVVAAGGAAHVKLFDAVNDNTGTPIFEWGDVPLNTSQTPSGAFPLEFTKGISALATGVGAAIYLYTSVSSPY